MARKKIIAKIANKELVEAKHKQIIEAASELFLKKGFHKASMRDIARESNIDLSYLYQYITTKDDILYLFYEYVSSKYEHIYEMIQSSEDEDALVVMQKAVFTIVEAIHELQREVKTMYTESRHLAKDSLQSVLERESEFVKIFETLIRRGIQSGSFRVEDPVMAANIVQFLLVIEGLRGWNFRDRYCFEDFAQTLIEFIMHGLRVDEEKWRKLKSEARSLRKKNTSVTG